MCVCVCVQRPDFRRGTEVFTLLTLLFKMGLRWSHHLLELGTGDAYNRGKLGVDSTRRDGRQLSATG